LVDKVEKYWITQFTNRFQNSENPKVRLGPPPAIVLYSNKYKFKHEERFIIKQLYNNYEHYIISNLVCKTFIHQFVLYLNIFPVLSVVNYHLCMCIQLI